MKNIKYLIIFYILLFSVTCTRQIAPYNQHAYEQATALKVEAALIVEMSNTPYNKHIEKIEKFKLKMLKISEYTKGIPKNENIAAQWAILIKPGGKSMFGFLNFWKKKSTLSNTFTKEFRIEIEKNFNKIIELESAKIRS